jgi:hypothetical protein
MNGNDERDYSEEAYNRDTMNNPERIPLPEGCDGTDVSWHGSRPECQGTCGRTTYDDYDSNSTENMPEDRSRKFMVVILGNATAAGAIIQIDAQVYAHHMEQAVMIADTMIVQMGMVGASVDSVYELC